MAKIANLRPKIGHMPLLSMNSNGHNSVIFHPIFTFFALNRLFFRDESNGVKIKAISLFNSDFGVWAFGPIFSPMPPHMGKIVRIDPKPP